MYYATKSNVCQVDTLLEIHWKMSRSNIYFKNILILARKLKKNLNWFLARKLKKDIFDLFSYTMDTVRKMYLTLRHLGDFSTIFF